MNSRDGLRARDPPLCVLSVLSSQIGEESGAREGGGKDELDFRLVK